MFLANFKFFMLKYFSSSLGLQHYLFIKDIKLNVGQ